MAFNNSQEMGRPITIKDEGVPLTTNVGSLDFAGAGVTGGAVGTAVTETINGGGAGSSPLTTKGDVWGFSSVDARIPIGADGNVLTADSSQTLGLKWAVPSAAAATIDYTTSFMFMGA